MLRVGLTGSIATGKSTVLQMFGDLGVPVFSADRAVHEIYSGPDAQKVATRIPGILRDGKVDRQLLSEALQKSPELLPLLEDLVHPFVRQNAEHFFAVASREGTEIALAEIPLLFETVYDYRLDVTLVAACSVKTQHARALARPGMNVEKLETLIARQMPLADKIARADHVISTEGTLEQTRADVAGLLSELVQSAGKT